MGQNTIKKLFMQFQKNCANKYKFKETEQANRKYYKLNILRETNLPFFTQLKTHQLC